jgi:hypothetical protein
MVQTCRDLSHLVCKEDFSDLVGMTELTNIKKEGVPCPVESCSDFITVKALVENTPDQVRKVLYI